jgi:hypothetical protein
MHAKGLSTIALVWRNLEILTFYSPCLVSLSDSKSPRLAAATLQAIDIIAFASFISDRGAHSP